jgi:hypothetical protein
VSNHVSCLAKGNIMKNINERTLNSLIKHQLNQIIKLNQAEDEILSHMDVHICLDNLRLANDLRKKVTTELIHLMPLVLSGVIHAE